MTESQQSHRKDEHLSLGVHSWRQQPQIIGATFDDVRWVPNALPELAVQDVNTSTVMLNHRFSWPFYIEAMTGGSQKTTQINQQLAEVALETDLAMAVGSQSIAIKEPDKRESFKIVRKTHQDGFLIANLGANHNIINVRNAIDMIDANAIELHLNVAQELTMSENEGDRSFYWLDNIATIAAKSPVPVIVKEVGFGMSQATFNLLQDTGVAAINVGGANGTNFAKIENRRNQDKLKLNLDNYGFSTVESLLDAKISQNTLPLIATGGIQKIQDVITSLMLGATLTSSAGHFLHTLVSEGQDALVHTINEWQQNLPLIYALLGAKNTSELQNREFITSTTINNFIQQRQKK